MKADIETLKDTFHYGYETFEDSRLEADEVWNMYHNRQWTMDQAALLNKRGQPKETFNVIKLFSRMLIGYYSTVVNTAVALPVQHEDVTMASMASDLIKSVHTKNYFVQEGDKLKLSAMISGIMCAEIFPVFTGERDEFGRPMYELHEAHVPDHEVVLDPMSTAENYGDARFMHRFKWVPEEVIVKEFGKEFADKLQEYHNHLEVPEAEYDYTHNQQFQGRFRVFNNYLLVHSVIEDDDGKRWSIYWADDVILQKKEITHRHVKWNYRVVKTHSSNRKEYYGIFREIVETQKAINQALVKLQLMINSQKAFVEENAVSNINEFTNAFNRVTGVIPVKDLKGIKVEMLAREALEQYQVIDRAFDRIQRILSVNDSFLGMAFASDSGRKVKLQQNATIMALRYLTERIELMYRLLGEDIVGLANQYLKAHQVLRVTDEVTGFRFIELNKPMQIWSGGFDDQQQPQYDTPFEPVIDPETGDIAEDDEGNMLFAPIPEDGTELNFNNIDIEIQTSAYNDEDEKAQLMIENVLAGNIGQLLGQVNPAGFFQAAGLTMRSMKTKYSPEISKIFEETAGMLQQQPAQEEGAAQMAGNLQNQTGRGSETMTLPQE